MNFLKYILSRGLPKTGQHLSYVDYDDGYYENGWWLGRLNVDNKDRFIAQTIGGDDVAIDRATGLMWAADDNQAGCNNKNKLDFDDALAYAHNLDFAGFTDWRIPNILELISIINFGVPDPSTYTDVFPSNPADEYLSSTTYIMSSSYMRTVHYYDGDINIKQKSDTYLIRCVRNVS